MRKYLEHDRELCSHEGIITSLKIFFRSALSHIDVIQFILQTGRCIFRIQGMNLEDRRDENLGLYAGKRLSATRILQDPQRVGRNLEKSWTQRRETRERACSLPGRVEWKYNEREAKKNPIFSARIYFHLELYSHLCIMKDVLVGIHN